MTAKLNENGAFFHYDAEMTDKGRDPIDTENVVRVKKETCVMVDRKDGLRSIFPFPFNSVGADDLCKKFNQIVEEYRNDSHVNRNNERMQMFVRRLSEEVGRGASPMVILAITREIEYMLSQEVRP